MADNIAIFPPPTGHPTHMYCVYALSGTYGLLPRILYYATLVFAIFGRSREWLVLGALVSALTYAGTAAIHSMTLITSKEPIFDLDAYGTWAILSTGALAYIAMVHWSTHLRNSHARIVIVTWGILIGMGLIFGRTTLFDQQLLPADGEPACYSSTGRLLQYPIELLSPDFNCTYSCFNPIRNKPMRQTSEIMAVPISVLKNKFSRLGAVTVGPIMFAAYASISLDSRAHTPSQIGTRIVMKYIAPRSRHPNRPGEDIHRLIYNASMERWYGGYFVLYSFARHSPWSPLKFCLYSLTLPWFALELIIDLLCLPFMVLTVALNELMIQGSGLPTNEANYAIGQWGPVVASVLVIIAASINRFLEVREERQKRKKKDIPRERMDLEDDQLTVIGSPDVERGCTDGTFMEHGEPQQECGVVVPKMAHVQTLREADESLWVKPKPKPNRLEKRWSKS